MSVQSEFPIVFESLRAILKPYAPQMTVKVDKGDLYSLDAAYSERWKKELFFASAQIRKNYVSFYLMPVYMYPELLKETSPELRKHMQGKSCFNFKKIEKSLFEELSQLTKQGFERLMQVEYS